MNSSHIYWCHLMLLTLQLSLTAALGIGWERSQGTKHVFSEKSPNVDTKRNPALDPPALHLHSCHRQSGTWTTALEQSADPGEPRALLSRFSQTHLTRLKKGSAISGSHREKASRTSGRKITCVAKDQNIQREHSGKPAGQLRGHWQMA